MSYAARFEGYVLCVDQALLRPTKAMDSSHTRWAVSGSVALSDSSWLNC